MSLNRLPLAVAAALFLTATACADPVAIEPDISTLKTAPVHLEVQGVTLTLEAHLWRDFMPVSPPDGRPLISVARIRAGGAASFPPGIVADRISLINGDQLWSAPARVESPSQEPGLLEVIARDGPKWAPGTLVDVVVTLRVGDGREHLLRVADQPIRATY